VEYLFSFNFVKQVQDYYRRPMISSGCFSIYRTDVVRDLGGWSNETMAEDMDLTWKMFKAGQSVIFEPDAVCYPIEPHDFHFMRTQLRRWSHGFVQNIRLHWKGILGIGYLRSMLAVAFWDALVAPLFYLFLLPLLAVLWSPWFLLGYAIDLPAVIPAVLPVAWRRREVGRALASIPAFLVLRLLNGVMMLRATVDEYVLGRRLLVYEKGH
jgi:biofilm PGA synthesis N-glycosyltransferase PgaC